MTSESQTAAITVSVGQHRESFSGRWVVWIPGAPEWRIWIGETGRGRVAVYLQPVLGWDSRSELHDFDTLDDAEHGLREDPRVPATVWELARSGGGGAAPSHVNLYAGGLYDELARWRDI